MSEADLQAIDRQHSTDESRKLLNSGHSAQTGLIAESLDDKKIQAKLAGC